MNTSLLTVTKQRLQMYYDAEAAILMSQSYTIGSRSLTRANLSEVRAAIKQLEAKVLQLENKTKKVRRIIPMDR